MTATLGAAGAGRLVLASQSTVRRALLENAGLEFEIRSAEVDEAAIKLAVSGEGTDMPPGDIAMILAQAKAAAVSEADREALVIGADQILICDGRRFDKPETREAARDQLLKLRGRTHSLISAVACARAGEILWSHDEAVHLEMRDFSTAFLGTYLARAGDGVLASVGAYQLEVLGIQLFNRIDGDYFAVLGLPMLPLLGFLRGEGIIAV